MRISSYSIGMDSERIIYSSKTRTSQFITSFNQNFLGEGMFDENGNPLETEKEDEDKLSQAKTGNILEDSRLTALKTGKVRDVFTEQQNIREYRRQVLISILEWIFGKDRVKEAMGDKYSDEGYELTNAPANSARIVMSTTQSFQYSESVSFTAKGTVTCADGTTVSVDYGISMSQSFSQTVTMNTDYSFVDPLVINFGGTAAELTEQNFYFDLDCDGTEENIKKLASGSGFLALDSNGDGIINDGSELFGTKSGDGFGDLSAFDEDGNGWIDEADSVWDKLKIWAFGENGEPELFTLREKGIGAMYLGSADTNFMLADSEWNTNGFIRKTGIFLYENGMSGSMQHMDYVADR